MIHSLEAAGVTPARVGIVSIAAVGVVLVMLGVPWGVAPLLMALLAMALWERRLLLFALGIAVPLTTPGWSVELADIAGRTLDVRLVITFAVAGIGILAVISGPRPRPTGIELLFLLWIGWAIVTGLAAADSVLTWAPPVARLAAYYSVLALATRHLRGGRDLASLMAVVAFGFLIPTVGGVAQFALGQADYINEAYRATAPGDRGPIALAFDGQIGLVLSFALLSAAVRTRRRIGWLVGAAIGGLGLIVSATRLVTITAWAVLLAATGLRRRWRAAAMVSVFFILAFVARPDLAGRFLGTFGGDRPEPSPSPGEELADGENVDASLRFRLFVWSTILNGWAEHPITGIGPGMTAHLVAEESPAERTAPHNDYIGVFAEMGVPGLALMVAIQIGVLRSLLRAARGLRGAYRDHVVIIGLLFVGINVLGALNNPLYFFDVEIAIWSLVGAALTVPAYLASSRSAMEASADTAAVGS